MQLTVNARAVVVPEILQSHRYLANVAVLDDVVGIILAEVPALVIVPAIRTSAEIQGDIADAIHPNRG